MTAPVAAELDVREALHELGAWVAGVRWANLPESLRLRTRLVLTDTLGVTVAGMQTEEMAALVRASEPAEGPVSLVGSGRGTTVDQAAQLNATAGCLLELDEGNKHARGHPAIHAFPAALGLAELHDTDGEQLGAALVAGHEVAARFGRASLLRPGMHPHGPWGAPGAAAAAAVLYGLDAEGTAGALDAASGICLAVPFESALRGSFVRNTWPGAANVNGLMAARVARAGLASVEGTAEATLGELLGSFDPGALVEDLGLRYDLPLGYLKRHSSCSFTHPAADAALALRTRCRPEAVEMVLVETHHLAAPLDRPDPSTRLAAMFSIPHVVAVALLHGSVAPSRFDAAHRADPELRDLARRVRVVHSGELDARLPDERVARVTVTLTGGAVESEEAPNPTGDADWHPLDEAAVAAKLDRLLGAGPSAIVEHASAALLEPGPSRPAAALLRSP